MGCSESKTEQEIFLNELWQFTPICREYPKIYIEEIKSTIQKFTHEVEQSKKEIKDLPDFLLDQITEKYLNNTAHFELFEKIRYHITHENEKSKMGYHIFFALIFLLEGSNSDKITTFSQLFTILQDIYHLKGNVKTNPILFHNIITIYIDLVSHCTSEYLIKILIENEIPDKDFEKYGKIFKTFTFANREKLVKELFSTGIFNLDEFFEINKLLLGHDQIRKHLVKFDYGNNGFFEIEKPALEAIAAEDYFLLQR